MVLRESIEGVAVRNRGGRRKDEKRFIDKLVNYTAANIRLNEIYPVRVFEINLFYTPSHQPLHTTPNTFTFHFITFHRDDIAMPFVEIGWYAYSSNQETDICYGN